MADITTQSLSQPKKEVKRNPAIGLMEDSFETLELIMGGAKSKFVNESSVSGADLEQHRFSSGTIEFNKRADLDPQLAIIEAQRIVQESQHARSEFIMDEEIRFEAAGMSTADRNNKLKLNASYAKRNTETAYHRAVIYTQLKREFQEAQRRENGAQIPSPAKQANALETQFEGGSGKMGSGTASLSSASGAVG